MISFSKIKKDPNKEGQNVFNIIPQQDLYDPWGRPGGGAPLVHHPTGQKFTRYSGSLQEKLVCLFIQNSNKDGKTSLSSW